MRRLLLLCCLWLAACAAPPPAPSSVELLFDDGAFAPASVRVDAAEVLRMSPAMHAYLNGQIAPRLRSSSLHRGLIDALYTRGELQLGYDTSITRNAAEAFDARAGNCMSLVLMTAAFARELGLSVRFQSVPVGETWGREGNLLLFVGHINVAIGQGMRGMRLPDMDTDWVTVDFLPSADLQRQRAWTIDEARVVAMYMNNKAAEALAAGQIDDAYAWARAAIRHDTGFTSSYNTLGVVYLRHGQPAHAERALRFAQTLESENPHVMSNLVLALQQQQRSEEAQAVALQLKRLQPSTPFGAFELGEQAMRQGDYAQARAHFEQAVRRGGDYHEFHFGLAQSLIRLGEFEAAARQLELAREASGTSRLQSMYAGKLQRLRDQLVH